MRNELLLITTIALATFSGCVSSTSRVPPESAHPNLRLPLVEQLQIGKYTESDTAKKFGQPDQVIPSVDGKNAQYWLYFEAPFRTEPRLSMAFNPRTRILERVIWNVRKGETEAALSKAMERYAEAKLERSPKNWLNAHSESDEVQYRDALRGLTIIYNESHSQVEAIAWGILDTATRVQAQAK